MKDEILPFRHQNTVWLLPEAFSKFGILILAEPFPEFSS